MKRGRICSGRTGKKKKTKRLRKFKKKKKTGKDGLALWVKKEVKKEED